MTAELTVAEAATRVGDYYGIPMLKRPLWGWEIVLYFFSEGISSGSFIIASVADLSGSGRYAAMIRNARYIALAALLPCPPLLIADLGRPERFHHMLRIAKLHSPMSMGAWALTGFSQPVGLQALAQFAGWNWIPQRALSLAGLPFGLFMLAYPGVLLATTSIPVWARNRFLGPLLAASSLASAAGILAIANPSDALLKIERTAHFAEAIALAGYVHTAGSAAKPLTRGRYARMFRIGAVVAGIALPALIASTGRRNRSSAILSGALTLAGTFALKWSVVHAGRESAGYATHPSSLNG